MKRLACFFLVIALCSVLTAPTCCPTKQPAVIYIAFGDSATDSEATPKYPWYIKEWLGLDDDQLVNEGESGQTLADGLPRLTKMLDCETYPGAQTVLFLMGGNDLIDWVQATDPELLHSPSSPTYPYADALAATLDGIEGNLLAAMTAIRGAGMEPIVGTYYHVMPFIAPCDLTPLGFFTPRQADIVNEYVDRLNARIYAVAGELGLVVADIAQSGALYGDPANWLNCNHASGEGNEILARFFYEAILTLGGEPEPRTLPGR